MALFQSVITVLKLLLIPFVECTSMDAEAFQCPLHTDVTSGGALYDLVCRLLLEKKNFGCNDEDLRMPLPVAGSTIETTLNRAQLRLARTGQHSPRAKRHARAP